MNGETTTRASCRRVYVRLTCIVLASLLLARCTTYQPVRPASPQTTDSVAVGNVRVTKKSGQTIHLESAFIRGDSIIGAAPLSAVPLDSVRSIEEQRVDAVRTAVGFLQLGAAVLILIGLIQFFGGGAACC